ncbi:hypothetical protein [Bradyrhizobium liaoningense]
MRHLTLTHLDGRLWASAGFSGGLPSDAWAWVAETVAQEQGCYEDDVGCEESEDGDVVTVNGVAAYRLRWNCVDKLH